MPFSQSRSQGSIDQRRKNSTRFTQFLGGLVCAVVGTFALGYLEFSATARVARLHDLSAPIERLDKVLLDCERGLRGYWQDRFREPVDGCKRVALDHISQIRELSGPEARSITTNALSTIGSMLDEHDNAKQLIDQGGKRLVSVEELDRLADLSRDAHVSLTRLLTERDATHRKAIENQNRLHAFEMALLLTTILVIGWLHWRSLIGSQQLLEYVGLEQTIWAHSGDALFLFDPQAGHIIDVNAAACSLLNMSREELLKAMGEVGAQPFSGRGAIKCGQSQL